MVKLLLDARCRPESAGGGRTAWSRAVERRVSDGSARWRALLVEHGADPNAMVESSGTPMMHARKDPELFQLLLAHGGG